MSRDRTLGRIRERAQLKALHASVIHPKNLPKPPAAIVARRLAEIPDDLRGLTARILGDPLPGDRRRA